MIGRFLAFVATGSVVLALSAQAAPGLVGPSRPQSGQSSPVPAALLGTWTIDAVTGDGPTMLEVDNLHRLIGREITIHRDHLAIWTVLDGKPVGSTQQTATLASIVGESASVSGHDFPDAHRRLDYIYIDLDHCRNDGVPLKDGRCPIVSFAIDPATGAVMFIPFSWSMAYLKRVSD
ncbi:hypothetical protein [Acidisoma cladoniae]|jgi:hypothetical protein|uniref:hypothetical protein n=1 Tax=Acidisoma cladoniae TaxID=3040935 RepID=UPI00254C7152|nr:hypothetical protein [Acidisoma sp. PAMC 29798]